MKAYSNQPRIFVAALALSTFGMLPHARAAVLDTASEALEELGSPDDLLPQPPAECETLRRQIEDLDEAIANHPLVSAVRDAYDASDLGRRERAATEAMNAEGCFARNTGTPSEACMALMEEIDACASAFENSADFQRVQELAEVVEINRLSERFDDLCAASMTLYDDGDLACEEEACEEFEEDAQVPISSAAWSRPQASTRSLVTS